MNLTCVRIIIFFSGFSYHCRRNISSGQKLRPVIVNDVLPEELIRLFINNRGKTIKGIKGRDYEKLKRLMDYCILNRQAGSLV
jgi:hypothetical protein